MPYWIGIPNLGYFVLLLDMNNMVDVWRMRIVNA